MEHWLLFLLRKFNILALSGWRAEMSKQRLANEMEVWSDTKSSRCSLSSWNDLFDWIYLVEKTNM